MSRRATPRPFDATAATLHRDASVLVIDKPVGWEVLRTDSARQSQTQTDDDARPGDPAPDAPAPAPDLLTVLRTELALPDLYPVHRLDLETSGCLVFAITALARAALERAFAERAVEKEYLALCIRAPQPAAGTIDRPLTAWRAGRTPVRIASSTRDGAKPATTDYATLATTPQGSREPAALVWARPVTGRTHQIRVHLASAHAPILGDDSYGHRPRNRVARETTALDRTALHAFRIRLPHPTSGNLLTVTAPLPDDMRTAASHLLKLDPSALDVPALRNAIREARI